MPVARRIPNSLRACQPCLARPMSFLLTASGLRNETQRDALRDMLGKPFGSANVVYVPTASLAEPGDHGWFVEDMNRLHGLGWREFDVLELNGLPQRLVRDRLLHADVLYVGGGNHYHLARSITGNGLADGFLEALEQRVYGVSAPDRRSSAAISPVTPPTSSGTAPTSTCSARRPWSRRLASSTGVSSPPLLAGFPRAGGHLGRPHRRTGGLPDPLHRRRDSRSCQGRRDGCPLWRPVTIRTLTRR